MLYAGYGKNYAAEGEKIMPKVSVIVPVYNAEKYLQECVDSILRQTLTDLELILVDDGSTDSSPAICDRYAEQDARVQVIHKPNGRAASARNAGLRAASGEYVAFVDSDDWISPEMYEKMLETGDGYFIHRGETLLGIGRVCADRIDWVASITPGAGADIVKALAHAAVADRISLTVASENQKAVKLYERLGFLRTAEISKWYQLR